MGTVKENKIKAKLTSLGKTKLLHNGINDLIMQFGIGDSDANYQTQASLDGNILDVSGNNDSVFENIIIKNNVQYNSANRYKIFNETEKYFIKNILEEPLKQTYKTQSILVDRDVKDDNYNLLSSIGIPTSKTESSDSMMLIEKNAYGQIFKKDKYLVFPFDYVGDMLDGNDLSITIGDDVLYSSLPAGTTYPDKTIFDDTKLASVINTNMVLLFSDSVEKPIKYDSWGVSHGEKNPYANGKPQFDLFTYSMTHYGDKIVGYVLLDKGAVVLIDEDLITKHQDAKSLDFQGAVLNNEIGFEVVCHINRNDFISSTNPTHNDGDIIRISEIGLYDSQSNLVAISKLDRHVMLNRLQPLSFSVSITL